MYSLLSSEDHLPFIFLFSCVSPVDCIFIIAPNACFFYLTIDHWTTCKMICYLSLLAVVAPAFFYIINEIDCCFSIVTFFSLDFHLGALLFSKMSKVRSETVSTEKRKVYLSQDRSSCALN